MNKALVELQDRGFIQQCTDLAALSDQMDKGPVTFYVGCDPTGPSLHIGHMVPFFAMRHLCNHGHLAIALLGGGTARIGDPSGKTELRKLISYDQIAENSAAITQQLDRFLGFDGQSVRAVNNQAWLSGLNYIDFLRDIGIHFSVNRMLSFDAYKKRLETGLSFIEFNYQLLQSYDFLQLHDSFGCCLQIGGDDQWGNIVAGIDLIRRMRGAEAFGLTFPLVTTANGQKMGKTEKGALFLDEALVSPYDFYQYWRNIPDADVTRFLLLFSFIPVEECRVLGAAEDTAINDAKARLAFEVTSLIHGTVAAQQAQAASKAAFGGGEAIDLANIPSLGLKTDELSAGISLVEVLVRSGLAQSNGEARRLIQQGGIQFDGQKIEALDYQVTTIGLIRAGKKRWLRVFRT
jgi:tyrosyl-tRNA synthetase